MALSSTFSLPRGFLGVLPQEHHFAPAVELQARPLKVSSQHTPPLLFSRHARFFSVLVLAGSSNSTAAS